MAKKIVIKNWIILAGVWTALALASAFFLNQVYSDNYQISYIQFPRPYEAVALSLDCTDGPATIKIQFTTSGKGQEAVPAYSIYEDYKNALTLAEFKSTRKIISKISYEQAANCPLIENIDYKTSKGKLLIAIGRKGPYLPAKISLEKNIASVTLPGGNGDFPKIYSQKPGPDSAAFPAQRMVSFMASSINPLSLLKIYVNGQTTDASTTQIADTEYLIAFPLKVEPESEYSIKAVASSNGNTTIARWVFRGEIPSQAILGKDRFKYLGWWGRITSDGVNIRKEPFASAEKIGVLSSANNVKVVKETYGQAIPDGSGEFENNLWYQIDGGKYPQGFIFSEYVSPMAQPEPPKNPKRPDQVAEGDNWIDVDIAKKIMTLFDYNNKPLFATYIASGRKENPTKLGIYNVWYKLKKDDMSGGPPLHSYSYNLKNIPWVLYYNGDYAIHGTYWHDKFGTQQSAGCTNMTQGDAKFIFDNTKPQIPKELQGIRVKNKSEGTVVYNHD